MAITTYSELVSAIGNWFENRNDISDSDRADEIIDLAEATMNIRLRHRKMEAKTDLTPSSNVCTLPSDYIEYKRVVEKTSPRRPLAYITEDAADQVYPNRDSGLSCHFMIIGDELTALPLSSNDIELIYYKRIPALSSSNTTNWLLAWLPNLYLHQCLAYAAEFVKDDEQAAKEMQLAEGYYSLIDKENERGKFGNAGVVLSGAIW